MKRSQQWLEVAAEENFPGTGLRLSGFAEIGNRILPSGYGEVIKTDKTGGYGVGRAV
jgi:hypothetical protein